MKFNVGDRVRINCKKYRYNNRIGTIVDTYFLEGFNPNKLYKVELIPSDGELPVQYWYSEDALIPAIETFRDRLKREHPENVGDFHGGCKGCPYTYGYEPKPKNCNGVHEVACRECWDRPISTYIDTDSVGTGMYGHYDTYKPTDITNCKRGVCKCSAIVNSSYTFCPHCGVRLEWGE